MFADAESMQHSMSLQPLILGIKLFRRLKRIMNNGLKEKMNKEYFAFEHSVKNNEYGKSNIEQNFINE